MPDVVQRVWAEDCRAATIPRLRAQRAENSRDIDASALQSSPTPKSFGATLGRIKMFTSKFVLAASLTLAATGAFADSGDLHINDWSTFSSTITREQVKQEMQDAYARGDRDYGERGYVVAENPSTRSRAEVRAELREAQRLGLISVGEGDLPFATAEQERLISKAGHDAAEQFAMSSGNVEG
jgi:hypothetical protein